MRARVTARSRIERANNCVGAGGEGPGPRGLFDEKGGAGRPGARGPGDRGPGPGALARALATRFVERGVFLAGDFESEVDVESIGSDAF